ncbi:MAG: hypothetical protein ACOC8X_02945 [Chloroflexota bacterium]
MLELVEELKGTFMCRLPRSLHILLLTLFLILAGCQPAPALPTPAPTAASPGEEATGVLPPTNTPNTLPPTQDLTDPTAEATPTAVAPTRQPADTPTPVIGPIIDIDQPEEGQRFTLGVPITVTGFAQVAPGMSIRVGLTSPTGWSLSEAEAQIEGSAWQATLPAPEQVTGLATLQAVIVDGGGAEQSRSSLALELTADRQHSSSYVTLFRPTANSVAVAGHNLFIDGQLWRSGGGLLQAAVLMDECQESVADVSFQLSTSSTWQGFVVLPRDVSGPACAVAWVGQPGEDEWRAAQMPITVLDQDDPAASGLLIANPRDGRRVPAGESLLINGVAYNVPGRTVTVNVSLDNGQVVGEAEAQTDYFGYWRAEVMMPPATEEAEAVVTAILGDEAEPDQVTEVTFQIAPP